MMEIKRRQRLRQGLVILMFVLFPVVMNFLSPYLIVDAASRGIAGGSFLFFAVLLVSSLFLGRAFCGWACPGGGAQEVCRRINDRPLRGRRVDWIKYLVWTPWLGLIVGFFVRAGGVHGLQPRYLMDSWVSVDGPRQYITYFFVLGLIMIPAAVFGRRAMCHTFCWMAPFMILGRKLRNALGWPALRLEAEAGRCTGCGGCSRECPMSLPVRELVQAPSMEDAECILCGSCADACPQGVIRFRFAGGGAGGARARRTARRPGAAALIVLVALGLSIPRGSLAAQPAERVAFPLAPRGLGGYGGPHFKATVVNGNWMLLGGGPLVLILRDAIGLGLNFGLPEGDADGFTLRYAAFRGEYIFLPSSRVHPSVGLLAGGGVARYRDPADVPAPVHRTGVLVLEPEAAVGVDLFGGFRLAVGGTWRLARGFRRLPGAGTANFSGPAVFLRLQYGVFPGKGGRDE